MSSFREGRFYDQEFPQLEEIVVVQVMRIVEMGAYVSLLEYDGKEGMMLLSELSKRRIRSVSKLLRVGRTEVCRVLRVDEEKGYIDLSKRRVAPEEAQEKEEAFAKAKAVHGIMRHVAKANEINVEDLCMKISWPLYMKHAPEGQLQEVRGREAYECFRKHVAEESNVWDQIDFSQPGADLTSMEEKIKAEIEVHLKRRLIQQKLRIRAKVDVGCNEYEGIDAIKRALIKGQEAGADQEEIELKIKLIAHPLFVVTCECREKEKGLEVVQQAMKSIEDSIKSEKGQYEIKEEPKVVNEGQQEGGEQEPEEPDDSGSGSGSDDDHDEMQFDAEKVGLADMAEAEKEEKGDKDEKEEEED
mmetsp:Transcript_43891/g.80449  ORF Transcript_43891/g.80449 Transcript_43891/m.80449 type:complete len:358 (+) Transcript_43891:43-1116(+)